MRKYKVAQVCARELARLRKTCTCDEKAALQAREAAAVAEAVKELSKFHGAEARAKLQKWVQSSGVDDRCTIPHSAELLSNRDPMFWFSCFVRLFPRGDCGETLEQRPRQLLRLPDEHLPADQRINS